MGAEADGERDRRDACENSFYALQVSLGGGKGALGWKGLVGRGCGKAPRDW